MEETAQQLLKDAEAYVSELFAGKLSKTIRFHTLLHTREVVAACEKLAAYHHLTENNRLPLLLAAWFHDTGYTSGKAIEHEKTGIRIATDFLRSHSAAEDLITKVIGCINATELPQKPGNLIEEIICDADLFHLGTDDFKEKNRLLREEVTGLRKKKKEISKKDWRRINIRFMEGHKYFTNYGKEKLQPAKELILAGLKQKESKMDDMKPEKKEKEKHKDKDGAEASAREAAEAKTRKAKENQTERGISTVFRIVAQNQNNMSQMADSKANIMISVNAIVLSIVVSNLVTKLETNPGLRIPVLLIVIVCVSAIVFSILATRPNVSHGKFTQEDVRNKKTNLLFFGNFYKMNLPDYDWAMEEMLNDKNYLYSSIVKDIYFLGKVLAKKYRFLRIAYNIFMFGLIICIVSFIVALAWPGAMDIYSGG